MVQAFLIVKEYLGTITYFNIHTKTTKLPNIIMREKVCRKYKKGLKKYKHNT